ncbi:MAG: transposase [Cyanobacteriota bacterium]
MTQSLSVKCKLIVPVELRHEIDTTLQGFADACNQILDVAKQQNCWNTTKLHHLVYKPVREVTGLKANHVCQAIRRVIGNAKAVKQVHKFRPTSLSLDVRTFKYVEESQTVGVTLKSGRVQLALSIGGYQIALLRGQILTSATLNQTRQGDYYINFVVEFDTPPTGQTPKVIGVDLGLCDIATTSCGKAWDGRQLQATRAKYARVRSSLQSKRTRGSRRVLKRLSGKEQRFQKNINHTISRQLVNEAKQTGSAIAFEELTGIRNRTKVKGSKQRRIRHSWAFYQLRLFTNYKAAMAGVPVLLVNPRYTSQTCHCCLHIGNRQAKSFKCVNPKCGWIGDADHNAANVISRIGGSVSNPERPFLSCLLDAQV